MDTVNGMNEIEWKTNFVKYWGYLDFEDACVEIRTLANEKYEQYKKEKEEK